MAVPTALARQMQDILAMVGVGPLTISQTVANAMCVELAKNRAQSELGVEMQAVLAMVGVSYPGTLSQTVANTIFVELAKRPAVGVGVAPSAGALPVVQQEDIKAKHERELQVHIQNSIGKNAANIIFGKAICDLIKEPAQTGGEPARQRMQEVMQAGEGEDPDVALAIKGILLAAEPGKPIAELTGTGLPMKTLQHVAYRKAAAIFALSTILDEEATEVKAGGKEWTPKHRREREDAYVMKVLIPAASPVSATTRAMAGALQKADPKSRKKEDDEEDAKVPRCDGGGRGGRGRGADRGRADRGRGGGDGRGSRGGAPTNSKDERLPGGFRSWSGQEKWDFCQPKGWCIKCAENGNVFVGLKSEHTKHP